MGIIAVLSMSVVMACGESAARLESDYPIYSAALQSLIDSTAPSRLLIRRVAAVNAYEGDLYDTSDVRVFQEMAPAMDTRLLAHAAARLTEKPQLLDSFTVKGSHEFVADSVWERLVHMPMLPAFQLQDSVFGSGATVVCLTPPARMHDQALLYIAEGCFDRGSIGGQYYFLKRIAGRWTVSATVPMSIN